MLKKKNIKNYYLVTKLVLIYYILIDGRLRAERIFSRLEKKRITGIVRIFVIASGLIIERMIQFFN